MNKIYLRQNPYIFLGTENVKNEEELVVNIDTGSFDFNLITKYTLTNGEIVETFNFEDKKIIIPKDFLQAGELKIAINMTKFDRVIKTWYISLVIAEESLDIKEFNEFVKSEIQGLKEHIKVLEERTKIIL